MKSVNPLWRRLMPASLALLCVGAGMNTAEAQPARLCEELLLQHRLGDRYGDK